MSAPRVWLITGCSSGLGLELLNYVLSKGDIAIATLRKPAVLADLRAQYTAERLLILKLDVTSRSEVSAAFAQAKEAFGRLDVVVSNAGYCILGEIEATPDDVARGIFETNFWGSVYVIQEAVKFFREVNAPGKGGRIIQLSSLWGLVGFPGSGFYSASKHAIEGLTESLAAEIDPAWNIKITDIPLGAFATNTVISNMVKLDPHPAYTNPALPSNFNRKVILGSLSGEFKDPDLQINGDPAKAVRKFYELSELESPPLRLVLGKDAITFTKAKFAKLSAEIEQYASWSDDVNID
ncbi:NAD-P-binding protein [Lenzites betulinus]|nr:NAD-P-binding protein [Lenzites betulinus]